MELLACNRSNQTSINFNDQPYILCFFKRGRIKPYAIGYCILLVSILFTFPLLKLKLLLQASSHRLPPRIWELHTRRCQFLNGSVWDDFSSDLCHLENLRRKSSLQ